jgi:hypothetical protein
LIVNKIKYSLGIIFFTLISCSEPKEEIPKVCPLSKEKLSLALQDIFIYEAALKTHSIKEEFEKNKVSDVYNEIYKRHGVTADLLKESVECYTQKREMKRILTELEKNIKKPENDSKNRKK